MTNFRVCAFDVVSDPISYTVSIENAVQAYQQLTAQYQKMEQQYQEAIKLRQIATGQTPFGSIFNNQLFLGLLPSDYSSAVQDIQHSTEYYSELNKFPSTNNKKLNAVYQQYAMAEAIKLRFSKVTDARKNEVNKVNQNLVLKPPQTPAEKADLGNALSQQQTNMQNEAALEKAFLEQQHRDSDAASRAYNKDLYCSNFPSSSSCN
jgi:hypothetical protein